MTGNHSSEGADQLLVAGADEAGRGPLAGAVVAAAVILDPSKPIEGLADSKKLSEKRRNKLAAEIREKALSWCIAEASVAEIDEINILHASMLAMQRAVAGLDTQPQKLLVDGNRCPQVPMAAEAIVGGDAIEPAISAASILAKVARDAQMIALHEKHPEYGFDRHKGYPTREHQRLLAELGPIAAHRRSFGPVKRALEDLFASESASESRP